MAEHESYKLKKIIVLSTLFIWASIVTLAVFLFNPPSPDGEAVNLTNTEKMKEIKQYSLSNTQYGSKLAYVIKQQGLPLQPNIVNELYRSIERYEKERLERSWAMEMLVNQGVNVMFTKDEATQDGVDGILWRYLGKYEFFAPKDSFFYEKISSAMVVLNDEELVYYPKCEPKEVAKVIAVEMTKLRKQPMGWELVKESVGWRVTMTDAKSKMMAVTYCSKP